MEAQKGPYRVSGRGAPAARQLSLIPPPCDLLLSFLFAGIFPLTGKLQTILTDSQFLPSASRVSFFKIPLSFSRQFLEGITCSLNNAFCNLGIARSRSFAPVCWAAFLCAVHWFRSLSCDGPANAAEAGDGGFPAGAGGNLNKMPQGCTPRPKCVLGAGVGGGGGAGDEGSACAALWWTWLPLGSDELALPCPAGTPCVQHGLTLRTQPSHKTPKPRLLRHQPGPPGLPQHPTTQAPPPISTPFLVWSLFAPCLCTSPVEDLYFPASFIHSVLTLLGNADHPFGSLQQR